MPIPPNTTSATAIAITSVPYSTSQRVDSGGTTYSVWYKFVASFSGVITVFGFGDLTTYTPGYTVYFNNDSTQYMNYLSLPNNDATLPNRPFLMPVVSGNTYFIEFSPNSGNPSPSTLTLTVDQATLAPLKIGDFISNREQDDEYEHPLTMISGSVDNAVTGFVQIGAPDPGPVTSVGLPHGDQGAILLDGHFLYIDPSFGTGKIFDANMITVATITKYESPLPDLIKIGSNRTSSHFAVLYIISTTAKLDTYDTLGTLLSTKTLSGVSSIGPCCINSDGTILYFATTGSNSVIKKYIIASDTLSTLATVTGFDIYDLLYLEDGSLLGIFLQTGASPPLQAKALKFDLTGSITNTYDFGSSWRSNFNPPRIGYALNSPISFWVTLKPQADFQTSELKNILISDGSTVIDRVTTNYLFGQYIGSSTATPQSLVGPEKSFALLVAPVAGVNTQNFVGTREAVPLVRVRQVGLPAFPGNVAQFIGRAEVQMQPGLGVPADPTQAPVISMAWSGDNAVTFNTEQPLSLGQTGAYYTRAYKHVVGGGPDMRQPACKVICSDDVTFVPTDLFVTREAGTG